MMSYESILLEVVSLGLIIAFGVAVPYISPHRFIPLKDFSSLSVEAAFIVVPAICYMITRVVVGLILLLESRVKLVAPKYGGKYLRLSYGRIEASL